MYIFSYRSLFIAVLILCLSPMSGNVSADESTALREIPTLQLNVHQISPSITEPIDGEIILTNLTKTAYDIQEVRLILPQSLKAIRPEFNEVVNSVIHEIGGEDERIYSIRIPRVKMSILKSIVDSETLLFVPGKYRLRTVVVLKESGNDKGMRNLYSVSDIVLEPPLSAALRGGVIGAMLLALFVPAYRTLRKRKDKMQVGNSESTNIVGQFFIYLISGSVVSVTAILFIYRMGSANLPISITVNDYLGGVIVGLFSYVFGDALYNKFFKNNNGVKKIE